MPIMRVDGGGKVALMPPVPPKVQIIGRLPLTKGYNFEESEVV
jgi:hypothetical protein